MKIISALLFVFSFNQINAQTILSEVERLITRSEAESHLLFLAADEMRGRDAGSPELDIAADYIRTQFKIYNVKPAPGTDQYFQRVDLVKFFAPSAGSATLGKDQFTLKSNMLVLDGGAFEWEGDLVYVGYGAAEDLSKFDIKGKMVLALAGSKEADNINKVYNASSEKFSTIKRMGGLGLVEILAFPQVPWAGLINFFNKDKWSLKDSDSNPPLIWLKPKDIRNLSFKENEKVKGKFSVVSKNPLRVAGKNVAGFIAGTDPVLKDEYVIITAHYDHVGVDSKNEKADSIFNGARDNATGTVAMLQAAKFLAHHPPKRSVIFMALTCEEKGLLGSRWYVRNPLVPLKQTVLNVNCDGVGYNDKRIVTSISLGRTNVDGLLNQAAKAFGFSLGGDPDPREGFYERSDQVSFAREGIPAIKLQPGLAKMDEEIFKHYHRPSDEVSSMDLEYITRFYRTFSYAAYLLTNDPGKPRWTKGDKFEDAGNRLYGY